MARTIPTDDSGVLSSLDVDDGTLYVDAPNNRVGINTAVPGVDLHAYGQAGANTEMRLEGDGDGIVTLNLEQDGAHVGTLQANASNNFIIQNQQSNKDILFKANDAGVTRTAITIDGGEMAVVINDGHDPAIDFRVEGDANTHLLFVDSSAESVHINGTTDHAASLIVNGTAASIALKEMAAAPADTAAFGQIWVKSDTPNTLYFTDDAGTDTQLGAGGGAVVNDASGIIAHQVFS